MNKPAHTDSIFMPPEWAPHRATWLAWPHLEQDFPGKLDAVRWAYCDFIRQLAIVETVELLCASEALATDARARLRRIGATDTVNIHIQPYERTWLRDSGPTAVRGAKAGWIRWRFNGWAKYDNFVLDSHIPDFFNRITQRDLILPVRPDNGVQVTLEGGAFDVDGEGTVLVTEECLLSDEQQRNIGLGKAGYEQIFREYLGVSKTIWLAAGCEGDDTHGHIDDIARFVAPGKVVVASADASDPGQYASSQKNISILRAARDAAGRSLEVIELPYPNALYCDGERLPASYLNFYIANGRVFVPTFNDPNDSTALSTLRSAFPQHTVIGIHCGDWILGFGSLHCSTQQEPL